MERALKKEQTRTKPENFPGIAKMDRPLPIHYILMEIRARCHLHGNHHRFHRGGTYPLFWGYGENFSGRVGSEALEAFVNKNNRKAFEAFEALGFQAFAGTIIRHLQILQTQVSKSYISNA
jgi:hypothetical protein